MDGSQGEPFTIIFVSSINVTLRLVATIALSTFPLVDGTTRVFHLATRVFHLGRPLPAPRFTITTPTKTLLLHPADGSPI